MVRAVDIAHLTNGDTVQQHLDGSATLMPDGVGRFRTSHDSGLTGPRAVEVVIHP